MPNKLTDAEIKRALECCANLEACEKCPMASLQKYDSDACERQIMLYALDLINRQEGENTKNENIIRIADKTIATLNAENESLKAEVKNWQGGYMTQKQEIANLEVELKAMRGAANSYKAEVERLKSCVKTDYQISGESLDNLLNELVG